MKTKFNYLLMMIFSLGLVFQSCEDDDDSTLSTTLATDPSGVTLGFATDTGLAVAVGETASATVQLSSALPYDLTVSLELANSDASTVTASTLDIPAGQTSADFTTSSTSGGAYTLTIVNAASTSGVYDAAYYLNGGTQSVSITFYDFQITTTSGDVQAVLDWTGTEDLDLYLRDQPTVFSTVLENSWTSQPEDVTLLDTFEDGLYYIGLDNWNVATPYNIPCDFTLTFPDSQELTIFTSLETTETADANSRPDIWLEINKMTNDSEVVYQIIIL